MTRILRVLALFPLAISAFAAGSVQQTDAQQLGQTNVYVLTFYWTGDASNGSVPVTSAKIGNCCQGYLITQVETVPGSPAPTGGYSIAINDAAGVDALNGAAASLSGSTAQSFAASSASPPIQGTFSLVITGQSVAGAKGSVFVYLAKPGTVNLASLTRGIGGGSSNSANWLTLANPPFLDARSYNFAAQSPGGSIAAGSNTVAMRPCPSGVGGGDAAHYLYVAGTGIAEAVLITGGTCTSGSPSGTVIVTAANSHGPGFTIASATAGIQEAAMSLPAAGGSVWIYGSVTLHGPVHPPFQRSVWFLGGGRSGTVVSVAADFPLSVNGVFDFSPAQVTATNADSGGLAGFTISFIQPDTTTLASYTHWPPAVYSSGTNHVTVADAIIQKAWDAITSPLSNGVKISQVGMSFFHRGITVDQCFDVLDISHVEAWPFGLTINQTTTFLAVTTNNYTLDLQQVDFGWLDGIISVAGKFATLRKNASNQVPVIVGTNIDMDTNGGFEMSNGYVRFSNVNVSLVAGTEAFVVTGGTFAVDGVSIFNSGSTTTHFLYNPSQANSGAAAGLTPGMTISNLKLSSNAEDGFIVYGTSSAGFSGKARVRVSGAEITKSPGVSYVNALFAEQGGTGTVEMDISHVKIEGNGGVSAPAFIFATNNAHSVTDSVGPLGWTFAVPANTRWVNNDGFAVNVNQMVSAIRPGICTFASLTTCLPANGYVAYCSDCTIANPCASSGTGAIAKRLNGAFVCN